jgi:hypothetical protein
MSHTFYLIEDISGVVFGDDQRWFLKDHELNSATYEGRAEEAWTLFDEEFALGNDPKPVLETVTLFRTEADAQTFIAAHYTDDYRENIRIVPMTLGARTFPGVA